MTYEEHKEIEKQYWDAVFQTLEDELGISRDDLDIKLKHNNMSKPK